MAVPVSLLSLATASPPFALEQSDAIAVARELLSPAMKDFERMVPVFTTAGVLRRQLARPVDWYRSAHDFPDRTLAYVETACDLFVDAATRALEEAQLRAADVDTIVTISSTGIATPSIEARVMARMGFREDVARIPVFGLGCAGGVTGLGLAAKLAGGAPGSVVLFVTMELCSLTFRTQNPGKADVIASALFGDGAAACILRAGTQEGFACICGAAERTWPDTLDIMGWRMEEDGLGVLLNRAIPAFARAQLRDAITAMLDRQNLTPDAVDRFICHPGGAKVIDAIEHALALNQGVLDHERDVLRDHGNMSAPTALFVLDRVRKADMPPLSVLTALGPGFTASTVTLRRAA